MAIKGFWRQPMDFDGERLVVLDDMSGQECIVVYVSRKQLREAVDPKAFKAETEAVFIEHFKEIMKKREQNEGVGDE